MKTILRADYNKLDTDKKLEVIRQSFKGEIKIVEGDEGVESLFRCFANIR